MRNGKRGGGGGASKEKIKLNSVGRGGGQGEEMNREGGRETTGGSEGRRK